MRQQGHDGAAFRGLWAEWMRPGGHSDFAGEPWEEELRQGKGRTGLGGTRCSVSPRLLSEPLTPPPASGGTWGRRGSFSIGLPPALLFPLPNMPPQTVYSLDQPVSGWAQKQPHYFKSHSSRISRGWASSFKAQPSGPQAAPGRRQSAPGLPPRSSEHTGSSASTAANASNTFIRNVRSSQLLHPSSVHTVEVPAAGKLFPVIV